MELKSRLKRIRTAKGLSQKDFATMLKIPLSTYQRYERGECMPSADVIRKIITTFSVDPYWLLTGKEPVQLTFLKGPEITTYEGRLVKVNVYALAGAGGGIELIDPEPVETICLPEKWVKPHIIPVKIEGESMEPTLMNGAVVGVDKEDRELVSGKIYAVWIDYEGSVIKRVFVEPDKILLKSDNPAFPEAYIKKEDFRPELILGRVKWVWQRL